jgi:hypothetical protein
MLRRLTALLLGLILLPSMLIGRGLDCVIGERGEMTAPSHGAHHADAHVPSHGVSQPAEDSAPAGLPHAPAQCVSLAACGAAAVVAQTTQLDNPSHAAHRVAADVRLTPDSPTLGVEPPPPRA